MSNTPHELAEEFPDLTEQMHALKTSDAHFARLADDYHEINREIHRIETNVEPASPVHESELRKQRMALKDEIYKMLTEAA
jgi:hypothetical protein